MEICWNKICVESLNRIQGELHLFVLNLCFFLFHIQIISSIIIIFPLYF